MYSYIYMWYWSISSCIWNVIDVLRFIILQVNIVLAAGTFIFMLVMIGLAMTEDPVTIGLGVALFFLGVPVYFITRWLRHTKPVIRFMGTYFMIMIWVKEKGVEFIPNIPKCEKVKIMLKIKLIVFKLILFFFFKPYRQNCVTNV